MNDPCRLELRGLSGSEPCGACNQPAREHRGHREYVEMADPEDGITAFAWSCLADGCCPNTCTTCHPVEPDVTVRQVVMSQEAYDAAIAGARADGQRSGPYAAIVYALEDALGVHDMIRDDAKAWHKVASVDGIRAFVADYRRLYQARPLTKIAAALGCDANEVECIEMIEAIKATRDSAYEAGRHDDASARRREIRAIASALGCDADEAACLDRVKFLSGRADVLNDRQDEWERILSERDEELALYSEIASAVGVDDNAPIDTKTIVARVRELTAAESTRDAAVDLASNRGEQVSRLTAELAKGFV